MTALTVYLSSTASSTLSTANQLYSTSGSPSTTSTSTSTGTTKQWGEVYSQSGGSWTGASSEPSPDGKGWLWDVTTLEGMQINSGSWSATITLQNSGSANPDTIVPHVRVYRRSSSGVYTLIVDMAGSSTFLTKLSGGTSISFSGSTSSATTFATGDKLYVDVIGNITSAPTFGTLSILILDLSTDTTGQTGSANAGITTPGYSAGVTTTTYSFTDAQSLDDSAAAYLDMALPVDALSGDDSATTFTMTPGFVELLTISDIPGGALQSWPIDALSANDSATAYVQDQLSTEPNVIADSALSVERAIESENLQASDIGGLQNWPIDALSVSDSATLFVDAAQASDVLSIDDSAMTFVENAVIVDAAQASDALVVVDIENARDAGTISASPASTQSSSALDALQTADTAQATEAALLVDVGTIDDSASDAIDVYGPLDAQGADDSASTMAESPVLTNNLMASEDDLVILNSTAWTGAALPQGTQSAADGAAFAQDAEIDDLLAASDASAQSMQAQTVDSLQASDGISQSDAYATSEQNEAGDNSQSASAFGASDPLTISEMAAWLALPGETEPLSITESATISDSYIATDTASVASSLAGAGPYVPFDALSALDALASTDTLGAVDAGTITDSFATPSTANNPMASEDDLEAYASAAWIVSELSREPALIDDSATGWIAQGQASDALFIAESSAIGCGTQPMDALEVFEASLFALLSNALDALSISDASMQSWAPVIRDALSASSSESVAIFALPVDVDPASSALLAQIAAAQLAPLQAADFSIQSEVLVAFDALGTADGAAYAALAIPVEASPVLDALLARDSVNVADLLAALDAFAASTNPAVASPLFLVVFTGRDGLLQASGRDGALQATGRDGALTIGGR